MWTHRISRSVGKRRFPSPSRSSRKNSIVGHRSGRKKKLIFGHRSGRKGNSHGRPIVEKGKFLSLFFASTPKERFLSYANEAALSLFPLPAVHSYAAHGGGKSFYFGPRGNRWEKGKMALFSLLMASPSRLPSTLAITI